VAESSFNKAVESYFSPRHLAARMDRVDKDVQAEIYKCLGSISGGDPYGLLFSGAVGNGKTSILCLLFKYFIDEAKRHFYKKIAPDIIAVVGEYFYTGPNEVFSVKNSDYIRFVTHAGLVEVLRSEKSETGASLEHHYLFQTKIILLDDLGRGYDDKSGWNISLLEEFFDYRWRTNKLTFITTNFEIPDMRRWDGWQRIVDRILDPHWIVPIAVPGTTLRI
jgi:DNA replication protein DnaC